MARDYFETQADDRYEQEMQAAENPFISVKDSTGQLTARSRAHYQAIAPARTGAMQRSHVLAEARAKTDSAPVSEVRLTETEQARRDNMRAALVELSHLGAKWRAANARLKAERLARERAAIAARIPSAKRLAPLVSQAVKLASQPVEAPFLLAPVRARKQYVAPRPLVAKRRPRSYMFGQFFGAVAVMLSGG